MTLPIHPNTITLAQVQGEFGGANPISLSEYYAGGSYVTTDNYGFPNGTATPIPRSGAISLANFHGATKFTSQFVNVTSTRSIVIPRGATKARVVLVGGGGGGGGSNNHKYNAGYGAGGGQVRDVNISIPVSWWGTSATITIGQGGAGAYYNNGGRGGTTTGLGVSGAGGYGGPSASTSGLRAGSSGSGRLGGIKLALYSVYPGGGGQNGQGQDGGMASGTTNMVWGNGGAGWTGSINGRNLSWAGGGGGSCWGQSRAGRATHGGGNGVTGRSNGGAGTNGTGGGGGGGGEYATGGRGGNGNFFVLFQA